jgi:FkbM family methyltransferase
MIKNIVRFLTPHGLIERRRRKLFLNRLSLTADAKTRDAVDACRYELWPPALRNAVEPWTLIDAGANEGEFTAAALALTSLKRVYAFEPQPACHANLQRVLQQVPEGYMHGTALGAESAEIELLCTVNTKMASILTPQLGVSGDYGSDDFRIKDRIQVPLKRLDDVIPYGTRVGLLKLDVQGYEIQVLQGAKETLRFTDALLMEVNYVPHYEGGAAFDAIHAAVLSHGFRTFGISTPYGGTHGPLWADAMFVRTEN